MHDILHRIEQTATPGTVIPKPEARGDFVVKGWGKRRGERALIYTIPNHRDPRRPYEKGINEFEWTKAFDQLAETGEFSSSWFQRGLAGCAKEGSCNFTTIGGIFELLGDAKYVERGIYRKV